jgi:predicted N-formylglutamate amidohydrolase
VRFWPHYSCCKYSVRNTFENRVRDALDARFEYEPIQLAYTIQHSYTPDFVDVQRKEIIEAKGLFDAEDRRKMRAIRAQHPDWKVTILFQNPKRKISKNSKTTYAEWCTKNGIEWAQLSA